MSKIIKGINFPNISVDTNENDCIQITQNGKEYFNIILFDKQNASKVANLIFDFEKETLNLLKTNHGYWYNGNGWIRQDQPELGQSILTDDEFLTYLKTL